MVFKEKSDIERILLKIHAQRKSKNRASKKKGAPKSRYAQYKEQCDLRSLLNQVNNDKKDRNKDEHAPFQNQAIHVLIKKLMPELA